MRILYKIILSENETIVAAQACSFLLHEALRKATDPNTKSTGIQSLAWSDMAEYCENILRKLTGASRLWSRKQQDETQATSEPDDESD